MLPRVAVDRLDPVAAARPTTLYARIAWRPWQCWYTKCRQEKPEEVAELRCSRGAAAQVEHEASTSKIGEDQLFYFQQRGLDMEEAVSMIISGFCREVFNELPMEFAEEVNQLMSLKLEGSVG